MSGFSFHFLPSPEEADDAPPARQTTAAATATTTSFEWVPHDEDLRSMLVQHGQGLKWTTISGLLEGDIKVIVRPDDHNNNKDAHTDIVPGEYEGGLKVWECSVDLCQYILQHTTAFLPPSNNKMSSSGDVDTYSILELGCGHGLPGICLMRHAMKENYSSCKVFFADFNEFVVKDVTIPNVYLNILHDLDTTPSQTNKALDYLKDHAAFGAGDWQAMSPAFPSKNSLDILLASETTYSVQAARGTAAVILAHLRPTTGVAWISHKRFYFGVGGGRDAFCQALLDQAQQTPWQPGIETVHVVDTGTGNIREILAVRLLPKKI